MFGGGEAQGLVGLGHEIADEDAGGAAGGEGFGDAFDEQVGDERGVKGAGAKGDEVGIGDGAEGFGHGLGVGGFEHELDDGAARGGDVGFAADDGAVVHLGGEAGVGEGGGVDAAASGQDLRRHLHSLGEVAGDAGKRGDEEIAEAVATEAAAFEAVLEEAGEQMLVFGKGDQAIADVAWGEHLELFAEPAGGATVVGDGDDGGEVADKTGRVVGRLRLRGPSVAALDSVGGTGRGDKALQAAEQRGKASASADGDDTELPGRGERLEHGAFSVKRSR